MFAMSLAEYTLYALVASVFVCLAVWAASRGMKLDSDRRKLKESRNELASDVLKSMRNKGAGAPSTKKPLVYLPETIAEESPKVDPPKNPWLWMLVDPTETIRQIVDFDPQHYVLLLSCLYGINAMLIGTIQNPYLHLNYTALLPVVPVGGPLLGLLSVSLISWALRMAAPHSGGHASEHETQAAFAWSLLPEIYVLPLTFAAAIAVSPDTGSARANATTALIIATLVSSVASRLWSFVLLLNTLAEVNQFSRWNAFTTLVTAGLILFVLSILFVLPFAGMYFVLGLSLRMLLLAMVIAALAVFVFAKVAWS
jgi:hypothetical protein